MKRFHVHVHVQDLAQSIGFYSKLFAAEPARVESDYAKWMLDDPAVNFAISTRGAEVGIDHLGIQTDDIPGVLGRLAARGVVPRKPVADFGFWRYVMVGAPDGILIELFEVTPGAVPEALRGYF